MNKHQVNGVAKGALGKFQTHVGKTTGNGAQVARGTMKQAEGRLQKAYGDLKAALKNSRHT
ncbi:CsbD family protein [Ramlibacter sp. WS9]|uniref:CsbD family protein n=1 Tax=Ramlibacter sp. WS9 TaxID=1882741 RepID=UPI0011442821|nr:CsbD family protein [Ramlibacter sp. WS9]ROZ61814.1 CsbD family protein [Ramlibacter sp. WS9]